MTTNKKIKYTITSVALLVAATHVAFPNVNIDIITVVLIALAIVPWLEPLFKSVELPGGLKLEFRDLQKVEYEAIKAGLINPEQEEKVKAIHSDSKSYPFVEIAEQNQELALVGLRVEIEKRLRDIAAKYGVETKRSSIMNLINSLTKNEILTDEESMSLRDMIVTLNQAAHGVEYDQRNADWVMQVGPKILESLDSKVESRGGIFSHINPEAKEHWIDKSLAECDWTTNYEWGECIKKHTKLWENEVNNIYSALLKKLDTEQKEQLMKSQDYWNAQVSLDREILYSIPNLQAKVGREGLFIAATTFMGKVKARALELEEFLSLVN